MPNAPAACAAQPAARELRVPEGWQAIDFISDLHLCQAMPHTFAGFQRHLQSTTANAVFILGDLFELWVGDDMVQQPFERRCVQALHAASERLTLAFMAGNRDFLVGPQLLLQAGMLGLHEPTALQAFGRRVLLSHGDAWCLDDVPYQAFRQEVRSKAWQARFLAQGLPQRLQVAQEIRSASRERQRFDGAANTDVHTPTALAQLQAAQATVLVHGHTHRPGSQTLAPGFERHVLSDWDLDDGQGLGTARRAEVLRLDRTGFQRLSLLSH
jgi:UDP-2,3-diacylglucosamine hydrolase